MTRRPLSWVLRKPVSYDVYGFLEQRCLNTLVVALLTFSVRYNVGVGRSIACVLCWAVGASSTGKISRWCAIHVLEVSSPYRLPRRELA